MALLNEDYLKLPENYLFTEIHRKVNIFKITRPGSKVIHLDAGDSNHILQGEYVDSFRLSCIITYFKVSAKFGNKHMPVKQLKVVNRHFFR